MHSIMMLLAWTIDLWLDRLTVVMLSVVMSVLGIAYLVQHSFNGNRIQLSIRPSCMRSTCENARVVADVCYSDRRLSARANGYGGAVFLWCRSGHCTNSSRSRPLAKQIT